MFVLLQTFAIDLIDRERFNLVIGGVFLAIVLFSPDGLLGLWATLRARFGPSQADASQPQEESNRESEEENVRSHARGARRSSAAFAGGAYAQQGKPVKIGLLATLEGPFAAGGADGMRGAELAVKQRGGMVAGRKIEIIKASSDAKPDVAVNATRKLVEQDKVDIMVGPLSGGEGIAVKDYSKTQPQVTFINGGSGAQATTLVNPSPNFFRFNTEGAQWMVGLGKAALDKGYKRVMVIAEDYAFPYSQVQGFMAEYCKLGGKVPVKAWVPLGGKDYSSVIATHPEGRRRAARRAGRRRRGELPQPVRERRRRQADGRRLDHGQPGRPQLQGQAARLAGRHAVGRPAGRRVRRRPSGRPSSPTTRRTIPFPAAIPSPSLFAYVYYINMKAALDGLDAVKGDLSDGQAKYREALSKMTLKTPTGDVKLDANRQAIGTTFITEVVKDAQGQPLQQGAAQGGQRQPDCWA